jgi:hypothetical protein
VWSKQDCEEDGRLATGVGSETEPDFANFAGIKYLCRKRDFVPKLALMYETARNCRHAFIIARFRAADQIL